MACACIGVGCTQPQTRAQTSSFEVLIEADSAVRSEIADIEARLESRAAGDAGWRLRGSIQRFYPSKSSDWPLSFTTDKLTPSPGVKYQLVAIARDSRGAIAAQARARTDFATARRSGIRVLFDTACLHLAEPCSTDSTCRAGTCVSAEYDPDTAGTIAPADTAAGTADGATPRDPTAIAEENSSCDNPGERRCADFGSSTPLVCTDGIWRIQRECSAMQRCDTSDGPTRGTCRAIATECVGQQPLAGFCDSDTIRVCDSDLLASTSRRCPENERCAADANGEARCGCRAGFVMTANGCEQATNCEIRNGGCDPLTTCTVSASGRSCGECPAGWMGSGESGCIPTLVELDSMDATLSPAFSPDLLEYEVRVGLLQQRITLKAVAPQSASIVFNGEAAESGVAWTSPVLSLGENVIEVRVFSSGFGLSKNYRVVVRREGVQEVHLKSDYASEGPVFGYAVDVSGDTVVVGAPYEDVAASGINGMPSNATAKDSGALYAYVRSGDTWTRQAYIKGPEVRATQYLGYTISISGDTLAVGVPRQEIPALPTETGLVYVYTRTNGVWSKQQELGASDGAAGAGFGYVVALENDRLVVGSPTALIGGLRGGAVYVFERANGKWTEKQKLTTADVHAYSGFGQQLALSGDSIVVGALNDYSGSGAAYVFEWSNGRWAQKQTLRREPEATSAQFGFGVGVSGDTLVVSAPRNESSPGEVHVYRRSSDGWTPTETFTAPVPRAGDGFGGALRLTKNALVIGAPGDSSSARGLGADMTLRDAPNAGAAYLYIPSEKGYRLSTYLKAGNTKAQAGFGASVSASEDLVVVGAPFDASGALGINPSGDDGSSPRAGAAYVFH